MTEHTEYGISDDVLERVAELEGDKKALQKELGICGDALVRYNNEAVELDRTIAALRADYAALKASADHMKTAAEELERVSTRKATTCRDMDTWFIYRDVFRGAVRAYDAADRAALPVLVPAVQDDVTRRIKAWICQRAVTSPSDDYNEGYQDALAELWEYLSATEEAPDAK